MSEGLVIALDGPDGVGKTTQVQKLFDFLKKQELDVFTTRHSGGTLVGEKLREISLSDIKRTPEFDVSISLAMAEALNPYLQAQKQKGKTCVLDRSPLSMYAYNIVASRLEDREFGESIFNRIYQQCPIDILFLLEADGQILTDRLQGRTDKKVDYFEKIGSEFSRRVHGGYKQAIDYLDRTKQNSITIVHIDASGSINEIHNKILEHLKKML